MENTCTNYQTPAKITKTLAQIENTPRNQKRLQKIQNTESGILDLKS